MIKEEITFQSLAANEDISIGYSDNDIVVVNSIQKFAEISAAHVSMNAIAVCTEGKVEGKMNGQQLELHKNQVAVIPPNMIITDLMVSPDLDLKAMFFTNHILQSFLHEKIGVWTDVTYIQRQHVVTIDNDEILFYTHFYDMLKLAIEKGQENPYHNDVVQSLLRSAILALCGYLKQKLAAPVANDVMKTADNHFQRFLNLLNNSPVKHRTVDSYATDLCISPKYLSAICKRYSGKTANEWVTEHVMEEIRYYLRHTDLSVKQVCNQLGFANPSFFGKYVKDHFGLTPMQLRKSPS